MQRPKITPITMLLIVALAAILAWTTLSPIAAQQPATRQPAPPQVAATKWEYKITTVISESYLNQLGTEGWEVCQIACDINTTSRGANAATYSDVTSKNRLILKRPRR